VGSRPGLLILRGTEGGVLGLLLLSWLEDIFTWGTDGALQIGEYGERRGVERRQPDSRQWQMPDSSWKWSHRWVGLGYAGEGYLQVSVCFVRAIERSGLRKQEALAMKSGV